MYHADKKGYMIDMNKHIIGLSKKNVTYNTYLGVK